MDIRRVHSRSSSGEPPSCISFPIQEQLQRQATATPPTPPYKPTDASSFLSSCHSARYDTVSRISTSTETMTRPSVSLSLHHAQIWFFSAANVHRCRCTHHGGKLSSNYVQQQKMMYAKIPINTAAFDKHGIKRHHLFADNKQLLTSVTVTAVSVAKSNTEACVTDVQAWCASHRLQHSPSKTEVIWLGTRYCLQQLAGTDLNLTIWAEVVMSLWHRWRS